MCDREAYTEDRETFSDEVLNDMGDRFTAIVRPYIGWLKFIDYLNSPGFFDMAAAHIRNGGNLMVVGNRIKLIEDKSTVH